MPMNNFIYPNWNTPHNVKSIITTRNGGNSIAPYNSFNLATHVGDNLNVVMQNRAILNNYLPSPAKWLNQTHSDRIICLDNISDIINSSLDYDASFTTQKNIVSVAMSADCIPILLTDTKASFVAAIHAGWRGLANNIIAKSISAISAPAANILVYIAPAICKKHFEVASDVFDIFVKQNKINQTFFNKTANNKLLCDLNLIAKQQLMELKIKEQNIYLSNMCTYCNSSLFYSFRRDGITGRIASLIWLT